MSASVMVSVLFTDLVDSTALAFRMGSEESDELRQRHFGVLREAIGAAGGVEVKNLGDGLMVAFTSPSRALSCAVGMQQAIERHNHRSREALAVRIGLSVGEAVEEDGDYFGDPVIEAARLCSAAEGGQILTSELVRAMVGRNAAQSLVSVGYLDLKGIPAPVAAVEVVWEPSAAEGQVPLPVRLVGGASEGLFGFFGRIDELETLDSLQKVCFTERLPRTVLVSGEAGIGKTTLIAHSTRAAHAAGATVLIGRCDEDLVVPYRPWIEALSHLVEHRDADAFASLAPAQRASLARLLPTVWPDSAAAAIGDPDGERYLLLQAVSALLVAAADETPLIVVLDDLHWADSASLQLLRHIIATLADARLLIVATYRDTDLSRAHPLTALLADLHREAGVTRLALDGLSDTETLALLTAAAGAELDDPGIGLAHALRRETDGNPFFTAELLRHLSETGAIYVGDDGRWSLRGSLDDMALPSSVRDVVARRVARLSDEAGRVLSIASVIGRDFDVELLAAVAERDEDSTLDLLDSATAAAVLVEREAAGRYQFTHALIQHTLYQDLSAARRQRLHHRIAETLEEMGGDDPGRVSELARHWVAATRPTDVDKALRYTLQAAEAAMLALAPDDAVRWFEQALELVSRAPQPDESTRGRIFVGLGTAQRFAGDGAFRQTLLDAAALAERIGDTDLLVDAALMNNRGWNSIYGGVDEARVSVIRKALARLNERHDDSSVERARLLAVLCLETYYSSPLADRLALAEEAVATARRAGDREWLADVLGRTHEAISMPETLELRVRWTKEAFAILQSLPQPGQLSGALAARFLSALEDCDGAGLRAAMQSALDNETNGNMVFNAYNTRFHSAWLAALDGDVDRADRLAEEALTLGLAAAQPDAFTVFAGQLLCVRWFQGRLPELVDVVERSRAENPGLDVFRATDCWVKAHAGRLDDAAAQLDREVLDGFPAYDDQHWLTAHILWADAAAIVGHRDAALAVRARLTPWHRQCSTTHVSVGGVVAQYLGMIDHALGDHDAAIAWYTEALMLHERLLSPVLVAWTKITWAAVLRDRGRPGDLEHARVLYDEAIEPARRNGWGIVENAALW